MCGGCFDTTSDAVRSTQSAQSTLDIARCGNISDTELNHVVLPNKRCTAVGAYCYCDMI